MRSLQANVDTEQALADVQTGFISGDLHKAQQIAELMIQQLDASDVRRKQFACELGKIYLYEGKPVQAEKALNFETNGSTEIDLSIKKGLLLALIKNQLGQPDRSDTLVKQAEALHPSATLSSTLLGTKGSILLSRGRLDEAQQLFESALQSDIENHLMFHSSQTLMNLGVVALQRQHYKEAQDYFEQGSQLADRLGAGLTREKALSNLSWIYCETGNYSRSMSVTDEAISLAKRVGAQLDQIQLILNKGVCQARNGERTAARQAFDQAATLSEKFGSSEKLLRSDLALGYLSVKENARDAERYIDEAKRLAKEGPDRADDLEPLLLGSVFAMQQGRTSEAESGLRALVAQSDEQPSLRWEAENTLGDLYEKTNRPQLAEQWYQRAIDTFDRQRLTLKSVELELPFLENGSDLYMGYMEHLLRAGRTGEALRLLDTSRAETLAEGLGTALVGVGKAADPRGVARRLGATILVYCLRPERSYLWAITDKQQEFFTLPGSGAILPLVARHNEAILGSKDLLAQKESGGLAGRALYNALLAPAERLLPKNGGRVVLVADSALSRLNFETLIAPSDPARRETPHYWIEDVSVTNARSLRLLAAGGQLRHAQTPEAKMLLIGDPVYAKGEYAPLPNAGAEMAGIAGHFATAERVVAAGSEASPEAYDASRPGRFRFLHFVAHATASELNPLDSAVILSSKGTDGVVGGTNKLYASEILKRPLSAELVTLSSCYSSGTRNYTGEGVVGLAWAFLRAGAHSVIGALWDVSDVSTPKLMDTMYTRLLAGDAPDAALRAAKLEMVHSDGVFRKPVYWGAFQLYAGR